MIELTKDGSLWTVTLNRADKANALTREMLHQLADIAHQAHGKAQVFVLTGRGKVFSAGMDLEEARTGLPTDPVWERLSSAIAGLPCLTIAALNGTVAGGAMGMVLACDLRVAVAQARFFYPVAKLGFLPQPSDPGRMAALIGPARTKLILMGGARLDANQALAMGLIDMLADGQTLDQCVAEVSRDAGAAKSAHIAKLKAMIDG